MWQRHEIQEVSWTLKRHSSRLPSLLNPLQRSGGAFDHVSKRKEIKLLEEKTAKVDFWNDPKAARAHMRNLHRAMDEVVSWDKLEAEAIDLAELGGYLGKGDDDLLKEVESNLNALKSQLDKRRFELMLSGDLDDSDALITIHSGAGGTESQDWAEMLLRMYQRWGETHSYEVELLDISPGEEAGIKSATTRFTGRFCYGYLRAEVGVHRLVRISPFDAGNRRHTSFAKIDVVPVIEEGRDVELNPNEVRVDTFRSSGHGGQHVNKTESAVRLTHMPTGLTAVCRNQRSQIRNRELAWTVLTARLAELRRAESDARAAELRGENISANFGNQIRSYVLHPYRQVKDLRSGFETSDTRTVLDGNLDPLIHAYLQTQMQTSGSKQNP